MKQVLFLILFKNTLNVIIPPPKAILISYSEIIKIKLLMKKCMVFSIFNKHKLCIYQIRY